MPDSLLLRFRDIVANTVEEHNKIVDRKEYVFWGWWKKPLEPMPDPGLTLFAEKLKQDKQQGVTAEQPNQWLLLINSANRRVYRAPLFDVSYTPGGVLMPTPEEDATPEYYPEKKLPAWFRIGKVEGIEPAYLENFVWSTNNRTTTQQDLTALPPSAIGRSVLDPERDFLNYNVSLWFVTLADEIDLRQRSDIVPSLSLGIYPSKGKYALHLSDLHFGSNHAFRNQLAKARGANTGRESMVEALLQDLKAIGIEDKIAMILVTGDLTWAGDSHEFANAQSFFASLLEELGLHSSQLVIVPGNHDIEWRDGKNDIDENAELNYYNFCKNLYASNPSSSFLRIHRYKINQRPITIIGLNSCRIESKDNAGLGFVGREQLWEALTFLNKIDANNQSNEIRIALVHHHVMPVNYIEGIDWETKRVSIMLDAEAVLRDLIFAKVRLILHGHQHQPFISEVRRIVHRYVDPFKGQECPLDKKIAVVGGGSIGVKRSHLNVVGRNAYNIIDLACEDDKIKIRTRLQSPLGPGFSDFHTVSFDL